MHDTLDRARWLARVVLAALVSVAVAALLPIVAANPASSAPGQSSCDPFYGCTPSTPPPAINPICTISPSSASPGDKVTGTLSNVPVGTRAQFLFDGAVVAEGDATGNGSTGSVTLSFTVPIGTTTGIHTIVFVGAGFSCDPTNGAGYPIGVLGVEFTNSSPAVGATGAGTANRGGSLARTGIMVALWVAAALVLLLIGSALVQAARRRRRRALREQNRVADLAGRR